MRNPQRVFNSRSDLGMTLRCPRRKGSRNNRFSQSELALLSSKKKVQLRISGHATLHADDQFANEQWAAAKATSRLNYCAVEPPGTCIELPSSGLPDFLQNKVPTLLNTERGRKNFTVISGQIKSLDWLQLSILGNRRARFEWTPTGLAATWLIP